MRTSLVPAAACAALFLALASCNSPGNQYHYRDLTINPALTASTLTPGIATTIPLTISFGLFNTDLSPMGPVQWEAFLDSDPTPFASGSLGSLPGQSWWDQSFSPPPSLQGSHTFTVIADPNGLITDDRNVADNVQELTLVFADADLSFSGAPVVTPASPTTADALTLTVTLLNTDTSGALATVSNVLVTVQEDFNDLASTTIPSIAPGTTATAAIALPAATAGIHVYTIIIDPDAAIPLRDRILTTTPVTVTVLAVAPG